MSRTRSEKGVLLGTTTAKDCRLCSLGILRKPKTLGKYKRVAASSSLEKLATSELAARSKMRGAKMSSRCTKCTKDSA